jgi:hypothetical protein
MPQWLLSTSMLSDIAVASRGPDARSGRHLLLRAELRGTAVAVDHLRRAVAMLGGAELDAEGSWRRISLDTMKQTTGLC